MNEWSILKRRTVTVDRDNDLSFSGHRAGSCFCRALSTVPTQLFSVFFPFFSSYSFWLICQVHLFLHLATKYGNSSRLGLGPHFFSYILSISGFNHALSFRCHLHVNAFKSISTPDLSQLRRLNPTMHLIFLLACLKFPICPRPNSWSSLLPQTCFPLGFSIYHTRHFTSQESIGHP